ncbi:hypothetical protein JOQ06_020459 [Pogonophryne albipinna]|uniref:Immunoglobulin subtype domain-containing protein n=1 Tax=Pogonophryne albipinna TaxID=1090488 RepID=A0AAD6BQG4_9TELE|nr:hypothetical protein JOQ06_020459 [Pogonophryne albipinna]
MFLLLSFTWIIAGITAEIPPAMHYRVKNSSICLHIKSSGYQKEEWLFEKELIVLSKNITPMYKDKVYYNPENSSLCITKLNETDSGTYSFSFINSVLKRQTETHKLIVEDISCSDNTKPASGGAAKLCAESLFLYFQSSLV